MKKPGRQIVTFDWAIKTILRDKANFDVLEGFLTALFKRPVVILDLLESESNQRDERDKYNRVDLLAKTEDGERIIVEVQYFSRRSYLKRLAYGTAKTIVETLELGGLYANLKKVYSVSLVYFDISRDGDDYIYHGKTEFTGLHTHNPVTLKKYLVGKQVRIGETNIFPEYYLIPLRRFTGEVRDDLDQWVYAFKNNEVLDEFTAPGIGALKEKLDYLKMDGEERRRFETHLDYVRSERGTIEDAHEEGLEEGLEKGLVKGREEGLAKGLAKGRKEGLAKGREEGLEKGLEKGREEGLEKGREEGLEKGREEATKTLVESLYDNGMTIEAIAAAVGLSEPAIRRLLNDE